MMSSIGVLFKLESTAAKESCLHFPATNSIEDCLMSISTWRENRGELRALSLKLGDGQFDVRADIPRASLYLKSSPCSSPGLILPRTSSTRKTRRPQLLESGCKFLRAFGSASLGWKESFRSLSRLALLTTIGPPPPPGLKPNLIMSDASSMASLPSYNINTSI